MLKKYINISAVLSLALFAVGTATAQRAGQSVTVQTGVVSAAKAVDLSDGNALRGALVGGAVGSALTKSSKGSSRRDRNAAIGAVMGASAQAAKTQPGKIYTVTMPDESLVQIATEQTEIQLGDCVYVEQSGSTANIRRAPAAACDPAAAEAMADPDIVEEMQEEAGECVAAKQQLIDADTAEATELALQKVKLLCYD